jgi:hypothetical protein
MGAWHELGRRVVLQSEAADATGDPLKQFHFNLQNQ